MSHFRHFRAQIAHKWSLLMRRLGYVRVVTEEDGVVRVATPLTESEAQVIQDFRVWVAHKQKLAGGGCGGCPSAGGCSEAEA